MHNNVSKYKLIAIGIAAEDKVEDEVYLDIYPTELQPVKDGDISKSDYKYDSIMDTEGNYEVVVNTKTTLIKAKWIPTGEPNRFGAPDVCKGEKVLLYQYGDLDEYYWMTFDNDLRLRKNEKMTIILSNRPKIAESDDDLDKVYYFTFDSINKLFRLHTDDTDGELTTYDFDLNTKDGIFTIIDGKDNMIELKSKDGDYTLNFNRDQNVKLGRTHNEEIGKDKNSNIKGNKTTNIDGDETKNIKGSETNDIKGGKTTTIGGDEKITITGDQLIELTKLSIKNDTAELIDRKSVV